MTGKNTSPRAQWLHSRSTQWNTLTPRAWRERWGKVISRLFLHLSGVYYPPHISRIFSFPPEVRHCVRTRSDVLIKIREYKTQWKPLWRSVVPRVTDWSRKSRKPVELWLSLGMTDRNTGIWEETQQRVCFFKIMHWRIWVQAVTPRGCTAHCNSMLNIGLEREPTALLFTWWSIQ